MPKCRPCLGAEAKELLVREFPQLAKKINALPACPEPQEIVLCPCRGKQSGAKRPPSAYNRFIGSCLKERPAGTPVSEAMTGCAARWRQEKAQGGR